MPPGIIFVDELDVEHEGTPFDADNISKREYTKKWLVIVNNKDLSAVEVCKARGIALPYSPFVSRNGVENDLEAKLKQLSARQPDPDDWQRWIVTGKYSTLVKPASDPKKPETEKPSIEWDYEELQEAPFEDLDRKLFRNSATQPFIPTPQFPIGHRILVYRRNQMSFDAQVSDDYCFTVNKDIFLGAPPGSVLCMPPKAKQVWKGDQTYWDVTYRLKFQRRDREGKWKSWQPKLLDQGMSELIRVPNKFVAAAKIGALAPGGPQEQFGMSGDGIIAINLDMLPANMKENVPVQFPCHIIDTNGLPINHPVCLDGRGNRMFPQLLLEVKNGKIVNRRVGIVPVYLKFRIYRERPFNKILQGGL